jgi:predicted nucleic acid-binding Zn ribbon protein
MSWRPLPGDGPPPIAVGSVVERVLRHLGAPTPDALETVFGRWASLVGDQIAARAEPVGLTAGILTVRAEDPAWANQLRWLERDLLARLDEVLGQGVVTAIEVRVGPAGRPGGRGRSSRDRAADQGRRRR